MVATGAFLVILLPFMFDLWPSGFRWAHPSMHPAYVRMIIAIYFSLGICLLVAARWNLAVVDDDLEIARGPCHEVARTGEGLEALFVVPPELAAPCVGFAEAFLEDLEHG
jgi:hypothetical protein